MNKELIIKANPNEVEIALVEDKFLVELHKEKSSSEHLVGDIYLGKVKKIMSGLNAAFVDVGYEKDAFLHYLDLGPQFNSFSKFTKIALSGNVPQTNMNSFKLEPEIDKASKIHSVIKSGQLVLVQIAKEPISTKGPRITSEISLAGRYIVLTPFSNRISISQKIKNENERNRLKRLILSIRPENFGVIIRTVSEGKNVAELDADMKDLLQKWETIKRNLANASGPQKIISELDKTSVMLRDLLNKDFNSITTDSAEIYEEAKHYIKTIAPEKEDIVKFYKSKVPIFEAFNLEKQIKGSFGKIVPLKGGVYLIIEHTEAMHVIDVNSGHRINPDENQETNALAVNLEAAKEIARQLRLRDIGGIIVIDFIDLHLLENRKILYSTMKEEMAKDNAKHTILPPSKFGLIEITRQRVRPQTQVEVLEKCPACNGTGKIQSSILIIDEIENNLRYLIQEQNEKHLKISVSVYIHAFLTKGLLSKQIKWFFKFKQWIEIMPTHSHHVLEYHFFNKNNDEIKI